MMMMMKTPVVLWLILLYLSMVWWWPCLNVTVSCLCSVSGVSHSVTSDMHIIQQESPMGNKSTKARRFTGDDEDEGSFSAKWVKHH